MVSFTGIIRIYIYKFELKKYRMSKYKFLGSNKYVKPLDYICYIDTPLIINACEKWNSIHA